MFVFLSTYLCVATQSVNFPHFPGRGKDNKTDLDNCCLKTAEVLKKKTAEA